MDRQEWWAGEGGGGVRVGGGGGGGVGGMVVGWCGGGVVGWWCMGVVKERGEKDGVEEGK